MAALYGWSDAPGSVPFVQPPMTAEDWVSVENARRESDAMNAFIESHTREEVGDRIFLARANPRWTRWWEDEPPPPTRWKPPYPVRRDVAIRYGASEGTVTRVTCPRCDAKGEIRWSGKRIRFVGMHLDHIKPRSRGGADKAENLRLLCPTCNFRRGNREVA